MNNTYYALITGASRGLGKEITYELAKRNFNLLLVSLKNEGLRDFCDELTRQYRVKAEYFETDFCESQSVFNVADWAISKGKINVLVNNAGIGGTIPFDEASIHYLDSIIQINIRATSLLTRLMLPVLKRNDRAYILNVASMASFSPIAYKTVYPASKAFIWSFSKGLAEELRNTGIHVSVLSPGPMRTNAEVSSRIENHGVISKLGVITTKRTARIAIRRLFNRDNHIIPGLFNKFNWLLAKVLPLQIKLSLISRVMKKDLNKYIMPFK